MSERAVLASSPNPGPMLLSPDAVLGREDIVRRVEIGTRVDRPTVDAHFVVKVRAGRAAGRAHACDDFCPDVPVSPGWTRIADKWP